MTRAAIDPDERAEFRAAWEASGVTCIFQNAGEEGQEPLRLLKRRARFTDLTDMLPDLLRRAATPDDVVAAKQEGRRCLSLTGNGVPLAQQWASVPDELRYIRVFFQLGIRMMHNASAPITSLSAPTSPTAPRRRRPRPARSPARPPTRSLGGALARRPLRHHLRSDLESLLDQLAPVHRRPGAARPLR